MIVDKQELRRLAADAIFGHWFKSGDLRYSNDKTGEVHGLNVEDDRFIAAANPASILSLLDELEQYRKDAERIEWLADRLEDTMIDGADPCEHHASGENEPWVDLWRRAIDAAMAKEQSQ